MKVIKYPHFVDHKKKEVYIHIESGFPTTLGVPHLVNQNDTRTVLEKEW